MRDFKGKDPNMIAQAVLGLREDIRAILAAEAEAKARTERGIFAVEIARHVAQSAAQGFCPEWRYLKPLIAAEYGRILREQPEMRQRDVRAREQIVVALFNGLPHHLHGALSELRTIMELVQMAHESTAFLLGFEIGREAGKAAKRPALPAPTPERRQLPASTEANRLTLG